MSGALSFLESVAGFTQSQINNGAADKPILLGTVDPTYVASSYPGTLPKVTFDGEAVLSGKQYAVMSGYVPTPGDRVVLVPVGTTYMIIGAIGVAAGAFTNLTLSGSVTIGGPVTLNGETWNSMTLTNSWTNFGSGYASAKYRKLPFSAVWCAGLITGGTSNSILANLPAAYRPTSNQRFPAYGFAPTTFNITNESPAIDISTAGDLKITGAASATIIGFDFIFSLDV